MNHFKYLIIGGGMTGDAAAKGIREIDTSGSIGIISAEANPPYSRPPLTKGLWKNTPEEKIWKKTAEQNVELMLNNHVNQIDTAGNSVTTDGGEKISYEKLLIATGGKVIDLPFGGDNIIYYRTFEDYKKLRAISVEKENFVVIGGGFIGSEIAAALAMNGKNVTMIFPSGGIGDRIFPAGLSEFVTDYYTKKNVKLLTGESVKSVEIDGDGIEVKTEKGKSVKTDAVIGGIGIRPDTELAKASGIIVGNGILVDEFLRTNVPSIYAAGDVANYFSPQLDKRIRVEHEDNALKMGKHAGRVMAGDESPYNHLPFFYSDLFDLGYEAVGELSPELEIFEDWKDKYKEGVVYYMKDKLVKGVLLWNVWGQVDEARKLIAEKREWKAEELKSKLPVKKEK